MSSFVIDRKEYIKIAGFISGLQECTDRGRESVLYWWDDDNHCLMTRNRIIETILSIYTCNVMSVDNNNITSYNLTTSFNINENTLFAEYYILAKKCIYEEEKLRNAINVFNSFISCFNYQVDDKELRDYGISILTFLSYKIGNIYNNIFNDDMCWGNFDLDKEV